MALHATSFTVVMVPVVQGTAIEHAVVVLGVTCVLIAEPDVHGVVAQF